MDGWLAATEGMVGGGGGYGRWTLEGMVGGGGGEDKLGFFGVSHAKSSVLLLGQGKNVTVSDPGNFLPYQTLQNFHGYECRRQWLLTRPNREPPIPLSPHMSRRLLNYYCLGSRVFTASI